LAGRKGGNAKAQRRKKGRSNERNRGSSKDIKSAEKRKNRNELDQNPEARARGERNQEGHTFVVETCGEKQRDLVDTRESQQMEKLVPELLRNRKNTRRGGVAGRRPQNTSCENNPLQEYRPRRDKEQRGHTAA